MTKPLDRIEELLAEEAVSGLSPADAAELERLLEQHEGIDRYGFERAASEFFLAVMAVPGESMPADLGEKLMSAADEL